MFSNKVHWLRTGLVSAAFTCSTNLAYAQTLSDGVGSIAIETVRQELESVPPDIRAMMSREQMGRFIGNVLVDRRLLGLAERAGIADLPQVRASIARASRDIMVRSWIDGELAKAEASLPDLTELARERYLVNQKTYVVPEAIRASHILFEINDEEESKRESVVKARALDVLRQLREGADFAELARAHSEDPGSKRSGGEMRWTEKGKFVPAFETVAYALKPGEISDLVRTRFGYHIIKLNEKREARQQGFDEVKGSIVTTLRKEMLGQKREDLLKPFQGREPIALDDATFEALKKPR